MPRIPFFCSSIDPYNLAARSHNRERFPIPLDEVWQIMSDHLALIHHGFNVKIHSFVLMKNHFHLIASFPEANLSAAMEYFMGRTSKHISEAAGQINQIYGNRCYRSQITNHHHYMNVYKYNYRNPVEAKICNLVEEYEFSTLNKLLGGGHQPFPLIEDTLLFENQAYLQNLEWLNKEPKKGHYEVMKKALRHKVFKIARAKGKPNKLDTELY